MLTVPYCPICRLDIVPDRDASQCQCSHLHDRLTLAWDENDSEIPTVAVPNANGLRVAHIAPSAPEPVRERAAIVAVIANREMHYKEAPYHPYGAEQDGRHAFLAIATGQAVGFTVLEETDQSWRKEWGASADTSVLDDVRRWLVIFAWVESSVRRSGIGQRLIASACRTLNVDVSDVAWHPPLTDDGKRLVQKLCPGSFVRLGR